MELKSIKTLSIAMLALVCIAAPGAASAQRYDHDLYRFNRRDLKNEVHALERESNGFRSYFEHNFRANGHKQERYDFQGGANPEHSGRNGQMTLKDAIQNVDEDFERLRTEVDHYGISRRARELSSEIARRAHEVDIRVNRVADFYVYGRGRRWQYDRSELANRWRDLHADIDDLAQRMNR